MFRRLMPGLLVFLVGCTEGQKPEPLPRVAPKTENKDPKTLEADKIKAARARIETLTLALAAYRVNHEAFPPNLETLTQPQPNGKEALLEPAALVDPWGRPYQYEANGPKNKGKQPDVWTVTPTGQTIGNWKETD